MINPGTRGVGGVMNLHVHSQVRYIGIYICMPKSIQTATNCTH